MDGDLIANASGVVLHPFLIFGGEIEQTNWHAPINKSQWINSKFTVEFFNEKNWILSKAATVGTTDGSMQKDVIG